MSFKTEKPFYPYREPEAQKDKKPANGDSTRLLRVFVIARERFGGTLGTEGQRGLEARDTADYEVWCTDTVAEAACGLCYFVLHFHNSFGSKILTASKSSSRRAVGFL